MRDIGIPRGIGAVGYTEDDVAGILTRSVENW